MFTHTAIACARGVPTAPHNHVCVLSVCDDGNIAMHVDVSMSVLVCQPMLSFSSDFISCIDIRDNNSAWLQ